MAGLPEGQASQVIVILLWDWICSFSAGQQGTQPNQTQPNPTRPNKLICGLNNNTIGQESEVIIILWVWI